MSISTSWTDDQLRELLDGYFAPAYHDDNWPQRLRELVHEAQRDVLNTEALNTLSDEALVERLQAIYRGTEVVPLYYKAFSTHAELCRTTLRYLVESDDALTAKVDALLASDGAYRVTGLGKTFWSVMLMALDPDHNPSWTGKTENALKALGMARWNRGDRPGQVYARIAEAQQELVDLHPEADLYAIHHFMHYVTVEEGKDKMAEWSDETPVRPEPPPTRVRYWKIAPGRDAWNWDACRQGGFIAVGWDELGDVSGLSRGEFDARRDELVATHDDWTKVGATQVWTFSRIIREGDRIVANRGTTEVLGMGTVLGPYYFEQGVRHSHKLPVEWDNLTRRRVDEYGWRRTLVELDKNKFAEINDAPALDVSSADDLPVEPNPPYPLADCAKDTHLDEALLARWVRAVERKGQAILYGPPGTGKTYVAERLARHLVGGGDGFDDLVQFHPAYAYEDFIQGIRPKARADGQLDYPIVSGRFLDFCREASGRHDRCVLIIDEINRANLARVFGEMMYLLEYRDREIPLAAGGSLRIPPNVRIIGTMNTADRSIALVDHALRRRFAFLALYPNYDILRSYHEQSGFDVEHLIRVLGRLNTQIGDRHYEVGITFFLRKDVAEEIEDIWRMEIEPYLEEYFFDQPDKVDDFRWERIGKEILS